MRLPRDLSGDELVHLLGGLGYEVTRQTGSHIRLTTQASGEHHITIPDHSDLRVGTVAAILGEVASHFGETREELLQRLSLE
jgi:predicted RNA binding protein YcfA (HicA-like mRNA interferase family)